MGVQSADSCRLLSICLTLPTFGLCATRSISRVFSTLSPALFLLGGNVHALCAWIR